MGQKCSINCIDNITCPRALGAGLLLRVATGRGGQGERERSQDGLDQEMDVDQLEDGYSKGMSIWKAVAPEVFVCWKM